MAAIINITDKLNMEQPVIQIGDKCYPVNDHMSTVLKFEELASSGIKENILGALTLALGEQAMSEINVNEMSVANFKVLNIAILAAMQGTTYEEAEGRFRKAQ